MGNRIAFICTDDGRGIDRQAVALAASSKGIDCALGSATDEEVVALLLRGGVSTTRQADHVSGRGVGLDVVRDTVARLRGEVKISSSQGAGTRVEIQVPISIESLLALVLETGSGLLAIPVSSVRGAVHLSEDKFANVPEGQSIVYDDEPIPYVSLSSLWCELVGVHHRSPPIRTAIVLGSKTASVAVGVIRVVGIHEVVVRPTPDLLKRVPLVSGLFLDEEGTPLPVLDPGDLVTEVRGSNRRAYPPDPGKKLRILAIDDSLTSRMLVQSILETAGYEVEIATSGEEGLSKAQRGRQFHAFVVDVEMPGMSGFEFVERIREDPRLRETPAILLTSRNAQEDLRKGASVGAKAYIVKGEFDQTRFLSAIHDVTVGSR